MVTDQIHEDEPQSGDFIAMGQRIWSEGAGATRSPRLVAGQERRQRQIVRRHLDPERALKDGIELGAYSRSRVREFILGGATEHLLHDPKVPLLLSD